MAWEFGGNDEWYRQRELRRGGRRSHFAAANEALRKFRDMVGQPGTPQAAIARSDNALQNLDPETLTYTDPEGTRYSAGSLGARRSRSTTDATPFGQDISAYGQYSAPENQAMNRHQSQWGSTAGGARLSRGDLETYQLPSGGFATVKRGSAVPDYARANPTGNQFARPSPAEASQAGQTGNFQGFGGNTPFGVSFGMGRNPREDGVTSPSSSFGYQAGQGLARLGTLGYNAFASLFGGGQQSPQSQNYYAYNPSPVPQQPRRYFDF